ncbi:sigma-54-dependent transcriptional regulator [Planctomicrobium piriforme]|uniref:DNA-binding transcriptional regulator NtrC n=1 Tax=Planctomicrobium piriforme TaxID=1576369 RepID=A0A1I3PFK4_9PLAN|nr:sigma-54 dependent transcriptional regulator [Planctomicrobium piriforme]SFJ20253.1 two-component system, NtrC family, nitrogen regulation response regulator GlnG [Planctomicrobium piriforme]
MLRALVIDDDRSVLHMVQRSLEKLQIEVLSASSADEGLKLVEERRPDVVLLDILMPRMSGLEVFSRIHHIDRRLPVIFITAEAGSESAIEAMQLGAYDYLAKPLDLAKLNNLVAKALETRRLMSVPVAVAVREEEKPSSATGDLFVGRSPVMLEVFKSIGRVSKQNVTVLIRGESGTGKELVARALYQFSDRSTRPFMAVNCAALPDTLLESELFGHEKGSFTGAERRRIGKFEQCNGGTLFLDEVGDMSPLTQGKVLRLMQEQRFERVGGNDTISTDVRMIAATNRHLEEMVEGGTFRGDLFYRLNVVTIQLPPLRERSEDVPLLLQYFLTRVRKELNKPEIEGISLEAMEALQAYPWPGNIRELQSVVRQCVLKATGPVIVPDFLPRTVFDSTAHDLAVAQRNMPAPIEHPPVVTVNKELPKDDSPSLNIQDYVEARLAGGTTNLYAEAVEVMERYLFTRVLQATGGNQTKTSEILGITRGKVRDRIAAFNITLGKKVTIDGE